MPLVPLPRHNSPHYNAARQGMPMADLPFFSVISVGSVVTPALAVISPTRKPTLR